MDRQRIIFMILFIIVSIALGFVIFWVFFRSDTPEPLATTPPPSQTDGQFPTVGEGQISTGEASDTDLPTIGETPRPTDQPSQPTVTGQIFPDEGAAERSLFKQLTTVNATHVSASQSGGARFYNDQDGKFYRVTDSGNIEELSDQVFFNVEKATWSPTQDESIIEYPDGKNLYYNFNTKQQITLPDHWEEFSFSHDGNNIAAKSMGLSPENRWLITSDPTGKNPRALEPMGNNADKVTVDWSPNKQVVALSRTGEALGASRQEVLLVGQNKENFKSIVVEGRGLQTQWSPEGNKLLHSVYSGRSDYKPELWIVNGTPDTAGQNRKPLGVNTWASKCTMSDERFAYCGVPDTLETGAGFAPQIADTTADTLYKIDTQTGAKTIISLEERHTIDTIFTGPDGKTLYFTDKLKSGIFQIVVD